MRKGQVIKAPELSQEHSLKSLVENRTIYNLNACELNIFETFQASEKVPLTFNDLVVTSMLRGKKVMHLLDEDGFDYLPGESVIVPSNVEMLIDFPEATFSNPTQCLALAIDHGKITETLNFLNEKYPKNGKNNYWQLNDENFFFQNNEEIATIIHKIIQVCQSDSLAKDVLTDLSLQELLIKVIQLQTLKSAGKNETGKLSPQLNELIHKIKSGLTGKIELKEIARKAGMSTSTLYRLFKTELGVSPVEYIILERIKLAKQYLGRKGMYIKNISYETGFEDSNYFIRVFKHYEGITPKQYQLRLSKND